MANKNIPEVRFAYYTEDWEEKRLSELLQIENGYAFKSKYFQSETSEHIVLTPGNVKLKGGFQYGKGNFYNILGEYPERFDFKAGDIFVTMTDLTPTAQTLGLPAIIPDDGIKYLHNQRLGKLSNFKGNKDFLFQLLCSSKNQKQIVLSSSGTTVKHTSIQRILDCVNHFPEQEEQQKIGYFFKNIDTLITQHQIQHKKLTVLKKAMLSKLFPKQGEIVPEIRFKGFSGDWEEKELHSQVDFFTGLTYSPNNVSKNGTFVIRSSNVKNGHIVKKDNVFVKPEIVNCDNVQKGDIVVVVRNGSRNLIGKHAQIKKDEPNTVIGAFMTGIRPNNSNYITALLDTNKFKEEIDRNLGATINQITTGNFRKMNFFFPKIDEQQKIGNYFKNLDSLIENHHKQIEKLGVLKKACLSKMFV